jgi:quercetin dioxygenase-like cupin family protein
MMLRKAKALSRGIGTVLAAGCVLVGVPAFAQEKAKIEDVYKQALSAADANQVNVRTYDVPPGWATPSHHHSGHMFLYIVEGSGAMDTEGETRTGGPGQVISQLPGKSMIMRNASKTERLKFVLFQVGDDKHPLVILEK